MAAMQLFKIRRGMFVDGVKVTNVGDGVTSGKRYRFAELANGARIEGDRLRVVEYVSSTNTLAAGPVAKGWYVGRQEEGGIGGKRTKGKFVNEWRGERDGTTRELWITKLPAFNR